MGPRDRAGALGVDHEVPRLRRAVPGGLQDVLDRAVEAGGLRGDVALRHGAEQEAQAGVGADGALEAAVARMLDERPERGLAVLLQAGRERGTAAGRAVAA